MLLRSATIAIAFLATSTASAQRAAGARDNATLRSFARAKALLDSAVAVHGGEQKIRAVQDLSVRMRGRRWMTYQSTTLGPPWNAERTEVDMVMDFRNSRFYRRGVSRYPADFHFEGVNVLSPQGNFFYDPTRPNMGDAVIKFRGGASVATHPARREIPPLMLVNALDRAGSLRYDGEMTLGGRRTHLLSYAEQDGLLSTILLDALTKRVSGLEWLRDDPVEGDQVVRFVWPAYATTGELLLPSSVQEWRNATLTRDDTLTYSINTSPGDAQFAAPASGYATLESAAASGAEAEAVRKLAENIYLLQALPGGNRVLFAVFKDYVVVFEAPTPQNAATAAMEAIRRTAPGKPVRYVTFSHHHDDHGGGLRPYITEGVTIVTTPANERFVRDVARARHTIRPDALSAAPKAPIIEIMRGKRTFTDGDLTMELIDVGPTSHVDEMLVAWFPKEKLLFQGDMLILPDRGEPGRANALTRDLSAAIARLGLDVQTIAGVHGPVGTIGDLRKAMSRP